MVEKNIPVVWHEKFNVNVKLIDEQHQYFFKVLKTLEKNIENKTCRENAADIFFSLGYYADHFLIREEIYLKDLNYPKIELHREKHHKFVTNIIRLKDNFANGSQGICILLLNFMTEYLHEHILGHDADEVEYFKAEGLQ